MAIRLSRIRQRLSQDALGKKAGLHGPDIANIENAKFDTRSDRLDRVAVALGLSGVDELYRVAREQTTADLARHTSKGASRSEFSYASPSPPNLSHIRTELLEITHRLFEILRELGPETPVDSHGPDRLSAPAPTSASDRAPKRGAGR